MKSWNRRCLLATVILLSLVPASFAVRPNRDKKCDDRREKKCRQVPEGGSAVVYLLGAGITCLGAMVVRSRTANPSHS
jgi:hypothetical protein